MFTTKAAPRTRPILLLTLFLSLPLKNAFSDQQGIVGAAIEWGGSTAQAYTYVFSGQVTCKNHACSNAKVEVNVDTASEGVVTQTTEAGADGRYQIELTLKGSPSDATTWKLEAHAPGLSDQESAEAEGRLIMMDGQTSVVVERPLFLTQA